MTQNPFRPYSVSPHAAPQSDVDGRHASVVVVGGGQAGLSMSWWLTHEGIDHVVLEASTAGHEWQDRRWDAFCLVTPNWQCALPGFRYDGPDPDGFMVRDEIFWVAADQYGTFGSLRFAANAKIVDPGGEIIAATGQAEAMACADIDLDAEIDAHRAGMGNLRDRRPELYSAVTRTASAGARGLLRSA